MPLSDLLKPMWKHSNPDVRKAKIEKTDDQNILMSVVNSDNNPEVRKTAVKRVTHQHTLFCCAIYDKDNNVRIAAMERITDHEFIVRLAKSAFQGNIVVQLATINRINDQDILAAVAKEDENSDVRKAAEKRLKALVDIEKEMLESSEKFVVLDKIIPVIKDVNEFSRIVQKKGIPVGLFLVMDDFTHTYGNLQNSVPNPDMGGYNPFFVSAKSGPCLLFCYGCHKLVPDSFMFTQLVLPQIRGSGEAFGQKSLNKCPECGNMNAVIIFNPK